MFKGCHQIWKIPRLSVMSSFSLGPYHPRQRGCCYSIFPCDFLKSLTHTLSPVPIGNTRTFLSVVLVALWGFLSWADLNFSLGYLNCRVIPPPHLFYSVFSPKCHFVIGCLSTNRTRQEGLHSVLYLRVFGGPLPPPPSVCGGRLVEHPVAVHLQGNERTLRTPSLPF